MNSTTSLSGGRPRQVEIAITILAANMLVNNGPRTLAVALGISSGRIDSDDIVFKIIDECLLWGISLGFLALLWNGINWARWLNLILAIFNIALSVYRAAKLSAMQSLLIAVPIATIVFEILALYLLFLSPGKVWFKQRPVDVAETSA